MMDATTNVTVGPLTAPELFLALIFMLLIVIWILGRWQRKDDCTRRINASVAKLQRMLMAAASSSAR